VLALGPTVPPPGTCEPAVLFGRPPASTQLRTRQGNRVDSNRCVAPEALNSAPILAGPETARHEEGNVQQTQAVTGAIRFVGLDVHRRYATVAAVDSTQQVVLTARRIDFEDFDVWTRKHLRPTDVVTLEATSNAWHLYDLLVPLVASVTVANPIQVALIAKSRVKTDPRDALTLARLLAAGMLPSVWVPPVEVRELRALGGHRRRLIKQRTQARNRLRAVLFARNLFPPAGEAFGPANRGWWEGLDLPASEKLRVRHDLAILNSLEPLIKQIEAELVRQSSLEPWADQVAFLVQLPGIGVHNAMLLLAAIGDIRRFDAPHKLVGYAGLGARVHSSGEEHYGGRITKQGRRDIRSTMVEAAWVAVGSHPYWKELFERLAIRVGRPKAIVAIARKLLVVVWHVLTKQVADREAMPEQVAGKFLEWSWKLGRVNRAGLTSGAFIRRELRRLQLGNNVTAIARGKRTFPIPLAEHAEPVAG
jgi:transposase